MISVCTFSGILDFSSADIFLYFLFLTGFEAKSGIKSS